MKRCRMEMHLCYNMQYKYDNLQIAVQVSAPRDSCAVCAGYRAKCSRFFRAGIVHKLKAGYRLL